MLLETRGSGGSTSIALKSTTEEPASTADADAREAEAMEDSMLWVSPLPEREEEVKQSKDVPAGKFIIPIPPICTFLLLVLFVDFVTQDFSPDPQNKEDPVEKVEKTPRIDASLVVGTNTSLAPSGGAPPQSR